MIRQSLKGMLGVAFSLILAAVPAFAKVSIDPDFKGSLLITGPDGNASMLAQGEAPPENIPAESLLEVLLGQATVSADAGDKVSVACLGTQAALTGAGSVSLNCGEESGVLKVVSGSVTLVDEQGNPRTLNAGDEYPIKSRKEETADPTAETVQNNLPADGDDFGTPPPVDARNIEAAPDIPDTRQEPASQSEPPTT